MNNNAETPGDSNPSGEGQDEQIAHAPRDAETDEFTLRGAPHLDYNPPPPSRAETARNERALRRIYHQRKAHPWLKKIPWIILPTYGFMRMHDTNYEEHYEQWKEQQRRNYDDER